METTPAGWSSAFIRFRREELKLKETKRKSRAEQFYARAAEAYRKGRADDFDHSFSIPVESLYQTMVTYEVGSNRRYTFRQIFDTRLRELLKNKKPFDFQYLGRGIVETIDSLPLKRYSVYFGIPIKKSSTTPLPFGNTFMIEGIKFQRITKKSFERFHTKECLDGYYERSKKGLAPGDSLQWVLSSFYFFRASVDEIDEVTAVGAVADAFEIMAACATAAQQRGSLRRTLGSVELKSRSPLPPPSIFIASTSGHEKCDVLWGPKIVMKADESLTFTTYPDKMRSFSTYRRICRESSHISGRIKRVLLEFFRALDSNDPQVRQLTLWRCLEIATAKHCENRSHDDVVKILGNFYTSDNHWRQQGTLIKNQRHLYVHQGVGIERDAWGSADNYLNWSHEYVRDAIAILLALRKHKIGISEEDLDYFFDLYTMPNRGLEIATKLFKLRKRV